MKRGWNMANICVMCRREGESVRHLFSLCSYTRTLLNIILTDITTEIISDFIEIILEERVERKIREVVLMTHFIIWRERCSRIFRNEDKPMHVLMDELRAQWQWLYSYS
jgi:hypothetical protein